MAIARRDDEVALRAEEAAELVALVREPGVGMVVVLVAAVGADDRCGRDEHAEGSVRLRDRAHQPLLLRRAEDRLGGAVWVVVRAAVAATLDDPDLDVASVTEGAVGERRDGRLFIPDREALLPGERSVGLTRPAVVFQEIVIVVSEVRGGTVVEVALEWHREDPVPLEPGKFRRRRPRVGLIIIFDVPGVHEEIEIHRRHRRVDLMPVRGIIAAWIIPAGHHGETDARRGVGCRRRAESAIDARSRLSVTLARIYTHMIGGAGLQAFDRELTRVVARRVDGVPAGVDGPAAVGGCEHDAHFAGGSGQSSLHIRELAAGW